MKREINQLWVVAKKYFELALTEKDALSDSDMNLTVYDLTNEKVIKKLSNYEKILYFTSFISSCAIRIYSIDANFDKDFENGKGRHHKYKSKRGNPDKQKSIIEISSNLHDYIPSILRHMTCHAEVERFDESRYIEFYEKLYEFYLSLSLIEIFQSVDKLMGIVKKELESKSLI